MLTAPFTRAGRFGGRHGGPLRSLAFTAAAADAALAAKPGTSGLRCGEWRPGSLRAARVHSCTVLCRTAAARDLRNDQAALAVLLM
jgi:hypothetical protein